MSLARQAHGVCFSMSLAGDMVALPLAYSVWRAMTDLGKSATPSRSGAAQAEVRCAASHSVWSEVGVPSAPQLYPVALRLEGRKCLVVGGGAVGARKVESLLGCGALVTLVAPEIHGRIVEMEREWLRKAVSERHVGGLSVERRMYSRGEVAPYWLVIAATGVPEVDSAVFEDAEAARVWVNSVDGPALCSFFVPAVHRAGPVTVAVSTGGASPSLAAWIRDELRSRVGSEYAVVAGLLAEAREVLRRAGRRTDSIDWRSLLELDLAAIRRLRGDEAAREAVSSWLREHGSDGLDSGPRRR